MKDLSQALALILARIAGFFDIFDLSFLVAGGVAFAALGYLVQVAGLTPPALPTGWVRWVLLLVGVYATGITAFATGRWVRHLFTSLYTGKTGDEDFEERFWPILRSHGLDQDPRFAPYLERRADRGPWRIYTRLWAELRHDQGRVVSFALAQRYWVMSATCDGLAVACVLWALVLGGLAVTGTGAVALTPTLTWSLVVGLLGSALTLGLESQRYQTYQREELVAAIAAASAPAAKRPTAVPAGTDV